MVARDWRDELEQGSSRLALLATQWAGSTMATIMAFVTVIVWVVGGIVYFGFGDTYQLYINTGTTIVTFLMVFLIQRSQNKDAAAIQLKLDELIASSPDADNRLIDVENLTEADVKAMSERYQQLARTIKAYQQHHGKVSVSGLDKDDCLPLD